MNNAEMIQAQKRQHQEFMIKILKNALTESDEMWDEGISHATIVGYLQGTIRAIARELENTND